MDADVSIFNATFFRFNLNINYFFKLTKIEEVFYSCVWTVDTINRDPLICTAGLKGVIRVFSPFPYKPKCALIGHGSSINDLKINPDNHSILLSASKDHTFRLLFVFKDIPLGSFYLN